jgi:hypothetical protein
MGFLFPGIGASGVLEIVLNRNSVAGNGFASLKMVVCTPLAKESPEIAVATHEVGNVFDMEVGVVQLEEVFCIQGLQRLKMRFFLSSISLACL